MAKIIISREGKQLQEMMLSKERISIGRRPHNDIVLDTPPISAEHAVIVTILEDAFLEDLNSTNGTKVNGQPIKKHFLQNNDVIELSKYRIKYVVDGNAGKDNPNVPLATASGFHVQIRDVHGDSHSTSSAGGLPAAATIKVLSGTSAGKEIVLTKALTTIGRPGVQVAVITRAAPGYCITHVEGAIYPMVNGESIGTDSRMLAYDDVIDVAGTQLGFSPG